MLKIAVYLVVILSVQVSTQGVYRQFGIFGIKRQEFGQTKPAEAPPKCFTIEESPPLCFCPQGYEVVQLVKCLLYCGERQVRLDTICTPVSQTCDQYSQQSGACNTCIFNHFLQNGQCLKDRGQNCKRFFGEQCIQCVDRSVELNGICTQPSALCATSDNNAACTSCYSGFRLEKGVCLQN